MHARERDGWKNIEHSKQRHTDNGSEYARGRRMNKMEIPVNLCIDTHPKLNGHWHNRAHKRNIELAHKQLTQTHMQRAQQHF